MKTNLTSKELEKCKEPSDAEIRKIMKEFNMSFYSAREKARNLAYGGTPPGGFTDWGTFWKTY